MVTTYLSDRLREQTQAHHQALEKAIIPFIKNIRSTDDYAALLLIFYTYFGGVELLIDEALDSESMSDYPQRRKAAALLNDLGVLNVTVQPLADGNVLPEIKNNLQALGAMYVMEGSTLGGIHIRKMIGDRLPQLTADAFTFFNGYGNDTQEMWQKFKMNVDAAATSRADEEIIIAAANDMFIRFGEWIRTSEKRGRS